MSNSNSGGVDFNAQQDPMLLLLMNSTLTQNLELQIQGGVSQVLQSWSEGASDSISAGDNDLTNIAKSMSEAGAPTGNGSGGQGLTGTDLSNALMTMNAAYNTAQTKYSNLNNQYSNVMQGGGTIVTDLTQVEQQALQLCQVTIDWQNNTNQLITQWSS